jgi:hypothetical protein
MYMSVLVEPHGHAFPSSWVNQWFNTILLIFIVTCLESSRIETLDSWRWVSKDKGNKCHTHNCSTRQKQGWPQKNVPFLTQQAFFDLIYCGTIIVHWGSMLMDFVGHPYNCTHKFFNFFINFHNYRDCIYS